MNQDSFSNRAVLGPLEFVVGCSWQTVDDARLSVIRVTAAKRLLRAAVIEGFRAAAAPVIAESWGVGLPSVQLKIDARPLHWGLAPLEVVLGMTTSVLLAQWDGNSKPAPRNPSATGEVTDRLRELLTEVAERAGQATAQALTKMQLASAWVNVPVAQPAGAIYLESADLEQVRRQRIPIEYSLIFDLLAAAPNRMMALVDLVDLAASKEIDDADLMGCINFFVDKRYLVYEQEHQVVKLTALGREARQSTF